MYKTKTISYWLSVNYMQHMKIKDKVVYKVDIHGEGMSDKWEEFWCWRATAGVSVQYTKNAFNTCPTILSALHNVGSIFVPTPSMKSTVTNEEIEQNTANMLYFYTCQLPVPEQCLHNLVESFKTLNL